MEELDTLLAVLAWSVIGLVTLEFDPISSRTIIGGINRCGIVEVARTDLINK